MLTKGKKDVPMANGRKKGKTNVLTPRGATHRLPRSGELCKFVSKGKGGRGGRLG